MRSCRRARRQGAPASRAEEGERGAGPPRKCALELAARCPPNHLVHGLEQVHGGVERVCEGVGRVHRRRGRCNASAQCARGQKCAPQPLRTPSCPASRTACTACTLLLLCIHRAGLLRCELPLGSDHRLSALAPARHPCMWTRAASLVRAVSGAKGWRSAAASHPHQPPAAAAAAAMTVPRPQQQVQGGQQQLAQAAAAAAAAAQQRTVATWDGKRAPLGRARARAAAAQRPRPHPLRRQARGARRT